MIFNCPNKFTVKATSLKVTLVTLSLKDFQKYFHYVIPALSELLTSRKLITDKVLASIRNNFKAINLTYFEEHIQACRPKVKEIIWEKF